MSRFLAGSAAGDRRSPREGHRRDPVLTPRPLSDSRRGRGPERAEAETNGAPASPPLHTPHRYTTRNRTRARGR
jgi:hypothetical protein